VFEKCRKSSNSVWKRTEVVCEYSSLCSVELHGCRTCHPTAVARLEVRHNEECWDVMVFESVTIILMYIDAIKICQRVNLDKSSKFYVLLLLKIYFSVFFYPSRSTRRHSVVISSELPFECNSPRHD
jgi:hypothetical protein